MFFNEEDKTEVREYEDTNIQTVDIDLDAAGEADSAGNTMSECGGDYGFGDQGATMGAKPHYNGFQSTQSNEIIDPDIDCEATIEDSFRDIPTDGTDVDMTYIHNNLEEAVDLDFDALDDQYNDAVKGSEYTSFSSSEITMSYGDLNNQTTQADAIRKEDINSLAPANQTTQDDSVHDDVVDIELEDVEGIAPTNNTEFEDSIHEGEEVENLDECGDGCSEKNEGYKFWNF